LTNKKTIKNTLFNFIFLDFSRLTKVFLQNYQNLKFS
jgi:hypothetical protein